MANITRCAWDYVDILHVVLGVLGIHDLNEEVARDTKSHLDYWLALLVNNCRID